MSAMYSWPNFLVKMTAFLIPMESMVFEESPHYTPPSHIMSIHHLMPNPSPAINMCNPGSTMVRVLTDIVSRGADPANIRVLSAVAAPPALQKLNDGFPGLKVYTGMIDAEVNARGYIVPGLGDAGDRAFGTPQALQK